MLYVVVKRAAHVYLFDEGWEAPAADRCQVPVIGEPRRTLAV